MSAVLKKRARMSEGNIDGPFGNNNSSSSSSTTTQSPPQSRLDLWPLHLHNNNNNYHAHFDCFSGAAGDMILASCIDAAAASESSDKLLRLVDVCIRKGMPELDGEFELHKRRVWRGSGQICATHITVQSRYDKLGAAPLPVKAEQDDSSGGTGVVAPPTAAVSDGGHVSPTLSMTMTTTQNSHSHSHQHGHEHGHQQSHHSEHNHSHGHDHQHSPIESNAAPVLGGSHSHSHSHAHEGTSTTRGPLRNLTEISRMLNNASEEWIPSWVREKAIAAFTALAEAEAHVHGAASKESVHFHEVGAVDSIVDMVGSLIALHALGVQTVTCSRLPIGEGTVQTDHGLLPVPAPAALKLMVGMPTCPGPPGYTGELVTPTGAALMRVLTMSDDNAAGRGSLPGRPPRFMLCKVGVGAGTKDFADHPNILRLLLGVVCSGEEAQQEQQQISS